MKLHFIENKKEKEKISSQILKALPEWFGLPESTANYVLESKDMPFWGMEIEEKVVGFLALKETSKYTVEIYVMGVLSEYHHLGIGSKLYEICEKYAIQQGYEYMQVKTVREGTWKEYDQSCAFYKKMGFKELECFPTLWDAGNPCQIFIKYIKK